MIELVLPSGPRLISARGGGDGVGRSWKYAAMASSIVFGGGDSDWDFRERERGGEGDNEQGDNEF